MFLNYEPATECLSLYRVVAILVVPGAHNFKFAKPADGDYSGSDMRAYHARSSIVCVQRFSYTPKCAIVEAQCKKVMVSLGCWICCNMDKRWVSSHLVRIVLLEGG